MASSFGIDVSAFVSGSQRLNQEKTEIKLVLSLLLPYFDDLCCGEVDRRSLALKETCEVFEISMSGDRLVFIAERTPSNQRYFSVKLFTHDSDTEVVLASSVWGGTIKSDSLSCYDVGVCHGLLPKLLEKMIGYSPDLVDLLQVYYTAAERAKK